jgi:hypothetical protein
MAPLPEMRLVSPKRVSAPKCMILFVVCIVPLVDVVLAVDVIPLVKVYVPALPSVTPPVLEKVTEGVIVAPPLKMTP